MEDIPKGLRYDTFYIGCLNRYFIFSSLDSRTYCGMDYRENLTAGQKIKSLRILQYAFKLILWITGVKVTVNRGRKCSR